MKLDKLHRNFKDPRYEVSDYRSQLVGSYDGGDVANVRAYEVSLVLKRV